MDAHQVERIEQEARRAAEAWRAGRPPTVAGASPQVQRAMEALRMLDLIRLTR